MCVLSTGRLFWPQVLLTFEFPWILREDDIMHDPDEVEDDHDTCEASVIRLMSIPTEPKKQREDREAAGHVPYLSWCRARGWTWTQWRSQNVARHSGDDGRRLRVL